MTEVKILMWSLSVKIHQHLNPLHSEWPKLYGVLAVLSSIGLRHVCAYRKISLSIQTVLSEFSLFTDHSVSPMESKMFGKMGMLI